MFGGQAAAEYIGLSMADQSWEGEVLGCTNIALHSLLERVVGIPLLMHRKSQIAIFISSIDREKGF